MKVGIIGAGFTGLTAGYRLTQQGHAVTIFEKDSQPGGLAIGYKEKGWDWTLEKHYHHWFTNGISILNLAKELNHTVLVKTPQTNWYVHDKIYQFASLKGALTFPLLTPFERIRQLAVLGALRLDPFWQPLEKFKANDVMPKLMGQKTYDMLWKSILENKFGEYADEISLAWFWARIKKRTQALAYPEGGFLRFIENLATRTQNQGGEIIYNTSIDAIHEEKGKISIGKYGTFDKVIVTVPSFAFLKLAPQLPQTYKDTLKTLKGIGATNLVLRLKQPFFSDNTYWLSMADITSPIMVIVEHTNFMDKKHYNNEHLVYLGNYMKQTDPKFLMTKQQQLDLFDPVLRKINPHYKKNLIGYELFKAPFAQPIVPKNYSKIIPPFETPLKNVYLANMQQVYPWDRETNYAVELGEKIAQMIIKKQEL